MENIKTIGDPSKEFEQGSIENIIDNPGVPGHCFVYQQAKHHGKRGIANQGEIRKTKMITAVDEVETKVYSGKEENDPPGISL